MLGLPALISLVLVAAPARAPVFELRALGVLGGDVDTNLSCYLLGRPGKPATLMIDGGSITPGIVRWQEKAGVLPADATWTRKAQAALKILGPVDTLLLTHAHLDHLGGFVEQTTLDLLLATQGRPPMKIVALPEVESTVKTALFGSALWADFTKIPAKSPALALAPLSPGEALKVDGFVIEDVPLHHAVPSAAFLIHSGDAAYLHLGDTGPSEAVWKLAQPLLRAHRLRAVALEDSFSVADEKLAQATGHLARNSFLLELAKLAGVAPGTRTALSMTDAQALALAGELAPSFRDCPVIVLHIKALAYERVVAELAPLRAAGLRLILPEQGEAYRF